VNCVISAPLLNGIAKIMTGFPNTYPLCNWSHHWLLKQIEQCFDFAYLNYLIFENDFRVESCTHL